jgi:protein tyrosine/serine phosphatase
MWMRGADSWRLLLAAGWLITGCGLGAMDGYAPLTLTDNFRIIEEGRAYRSAQLDTESLKLVVAERGIRTVINLRGANPGTPWYDREKATAAELGIALVDVRMSAHALPSREVLLQLYDALTTAEEPILIHCQAGADRSGAAAAIWRMTVRGDARDAALHELSPAYGHFRADTPEMDQLVEMYEPRREWIEATYPAP